MLDEVNSELVHLTDSASKELFIIDLIVTINVKSSEQLKTLMMSECRSEIVHCLVELVPTEVLGAIVVSNSESTCNAEDASHTSF